jgi:uncharacterized protein
MNRKMKEVTLEEDEVGLGGARVGDRAHRGPRMRWGQAVLEWEIEGTKADR